MTITAMRRGGAASLLALLAAGAVQEQDSFDLFAAGMGSPLKNPIVPQELQEEESGPSSRVSAKVFKVNLH